MRGGVDEEVSEAFGGCIMNIEKEIQRIAEYQNALLCLHERKSEQAIKDAVDAAVAAYENETYNFAGYSRLILHQDGKQRRVIMYSPFSSEALLCIYLKRVLDRKFHVSYPNRNAFVRSLFDAMCALGDMSDYTIFKFDFKDFFNSISSVFVYKKYIQGAGLERYQIKVLESFVFSTKYAYAGLNTSNIICEIIAKQFDELLLQKITQYGIIFYKRYIDDGILIFNRYISKSDCLDIINKVIFDVFYELSYASDPQCKTSLNTNKTKYIARRDLSVDSPAQEFDFLGYEFVLKVSLHNDKEKTDFQYGMTQEKIDKYTKRINAFVKDYAMSPQKDMELLRHQIKAFTHRTVYRINKYKSVIWKSKGLISNYCELRYRMDALTPKTERFLKRAVFKAFSENGVAVPYFLRGKYDESIYSLYNNMKNYRSLLFVELIGINKATLEKMCEQIGIDVAAKKEYDGLVRDYLIKVKVGH